MNQNILGDFQICISVPLRQSFNFSAATLNVLNFTGIKFRDFRDLTIFAKFCARVKFQNHKIAKLNTCEIKYFPSLRFSFS